MTESKATATKVTKVTKLSDVNKDSASTNQGALRNIRARVIEVKKQLPTKDNDDEPGQSKAMDEDPFSTLSAAGKVIEPPFDLLTLAMLPEHNSELVPCVEAMEQNIEGFGHRLVSRVDLPSDPKSDDATMKGIRAKSKTERVEMTNFFNYCCMEISFIEFRKRRRKDLETTGNAYFEIIRSQSNKIQGFTHLPSYQMRLGILDKEPVQVEMPILELQVDGSVKVTKLKVWKRFRRFIQSRYNVRSDLSQVGGYESVWFKEWGDPRHYNMKSGDVIPEDKLEEFPPEKRANEVVHHKMYSCRSPYGLPRFIGNLLAIFGDRAAEEINFVTFKNNNIPSMMLLVSNGQLTQGTVDRLESFIESQIQGDDNYSKMLILEAEGLMEGEEGGQVKLDTKPMVGQQHKDALFQNYSKKNQERIRRAFRLPPIIVGATEDYTRTTAETSRRLADEQVFAPERSNFDDWVNRILFPVMDVTYFKFKTNSPNTTDNIELVKILGNAEKTGGMTPRIARMMLEDILGIELPDFPEGFDPDVPFSLSMAEAVKNKADPTEPGQQLTALKAIEALTSGAGVEMSEDELVEKLVNYRNRVERKWLEDVNVEEEG